MRPVDLRSDTVTRPTPGMREAIATAEVGDDVLGDDPTVRRLEERVAALLGKEAALFVPSGTMANQVAIRLHTAPGDQVVMESSAHPFHDEAGAAALISGVLIRPVPGRRGILDPDAVAAAFLPPDPHHAPTALVCAEDTANRGGGTVHPLATLDALAEVAHARGAATHLDGARLLNAAVASGVPADRRARGWDTVSLCLSKGLGAPVGSVLAGPRDLLRERGVRVRKALGGGMRQAGLLAAAGLYALDHHVARLADDHRRARRLAEGLADAGYAVEPPETNMVYVEAPDAPRLQAEAEARGVRFFAFTATRLRLVTHLDVDDDDIERAIAVLAALRRGA